MVTLWTSPTARWRENRICAASVGVLVASFLANLVFPSISLVTLPVLPVLVAASFLSPRKTVITGVLATVAALVNGIVAGASSPGYVVRLAAIVVAWAAAAYGARRRQVHDSRMWAAAVTDPLTGLPNRALLLDHLERELRRRHPSGPISVGFVDLDDFKKVNDSHGHAVGDALLVEVGHRLSGGVRGGDEFALVCVSVSDPPAADQLCGRLMHAVQEPVTIHGTTIEPKATIGMVVSGQRGVRAEELLDAADLAMFGARRSGRRQLTVDFDHADSARVRRTGEGRGRSASIA